MDITVTFEHGWFWWKRTTQRTYRGSGTVWHDIETGRRPGTFMEARLADMAWLEQERQANQAQVTV